MYLFWKSSLDECGIRIVNGVLFYKGFNRNGLLWLGRVFGVWYLFCVFFGI